MQRMSRQIKAMILYHILRINRRQKTEKEISSDDIQCFLENAKKLKCKLDNKIPHRQSPKTAVTSPSKCSGLIRQFL